MDPICTRALLLKQVSYGESDRVVTLLTEDQGKVSAMARGARRSRKRFGAALALFVLAEAELRRRSSSSLQALSAYHALETHAGISRDIATITHASYVTELVEALSPKEQPDPAVFELLLQMYGLLAREPPTGERLRVFELTLLRHVGLAPQLDACVGCGQSVLMETDGLGMDALRGGVLCGRCKRPEQAVHTETCQTMFELGQLDLAEAADLRLPGRIQAELRSTMCGYLEHTVGRPLRSLQFIRKLSR